MLGIVAEKTGYPQDMLDLDLDLEADLGVDTVKQAETFAAVREAFDIPRQENLKLRDFPTLKHVVGFVFTHRPGPGARPTQARATSAASGPGRPRRAAVVATRRRAPPPRRSPPGTCVSRTPTAYRGAWSVRRCGPPRASASQRASPLAAGSRVVVAFNDDDGVGAALADRLPSAGRDGAVASRRRLGGRGVPEPAREGWLEDGPVHGVYWLPALDVEPRWRRSTRRVPGSRAGAPSTCRRDARPVRDRVAGEGPLPGVRHAMGGLFGQGRARPHRSVAACRVHQGLQARAGRALVKVVDFTAPAARRGVATRLLTETPLDPGIVEVGYRDGLRWTLTFEERPAGDGGGAPLGKDSVFVVTGAAGGITSAIVADLAACPRRHVLPARPRREPDAADPHVALLRADRERLKLALIDEAKARGEKPTPVAIDKQ